MNSLIKTLFTVSVGSYGLFIFGQYVSGQRITPDLVCLILLGSFGWNLRLSRRYVGSPMTGAAVRTILAFIGVALVSALDSRYGFQSSSFVQISMMILVIGLFWTTNFVVRRERYALERLCRFMVVVCGGVGWIGIFQFLTIRLTGQPAPFDFLFMNNVAGGTVWYQVDGSGNYRVNSIMPEPSLLGLLLAIPFGLVLIRAGLLGRSLSDKSRPLMPAWAAIGISIAVLVSGSSLAYVDAFVSFITIFLLTNQKLGARILIKYTAYAVIALVVIGSVAAKPIMVRLQPVIDQDMAEILTNGSLSSLLANSYVTALNLQANPLLGAGIGDHQVAYKRIIDADFFNGNEYTSDLQTNADTAASLFLRLLSETGVVGLLVYIFAILRIIYPAYRILKVSLSDGLADPLKVIALVSMLTASTSAFTHCFMRYGNYYFVPMWMALSIINCSNVILGARTEEGNQAPQALPNAKLRVQGISTALSTPTVQKTTFASK